MAKRKTARVILTKNCLRNCDNCVNTYSHIMEEAIPIKSAKDLVGQGFLDVCITGGEPLLFFEETLIFARALKELFNPIIYLYATIYRADLPSLMKFIDGIHFTIHNGISTNKDITYFLQMQHLANKYNVWNGEETIRVKSFRLYLEEGARLSDRHDEFINGNAWSQISKKRFLGEDECKIPDMETLFIIE